MEIKIEGNPGTGNTFTEVHIGKVENYNPAATTVINKYYGSREEDNSKSDRKPVGETPTDDDLDIPTIHKEILSYVRKVCPYLATDWKSRYMKVWEEILELDAVKKEVSKPGKQQGTNFNRNLVANILFYLDKRGCYADKYSATTLAIALEGDKNHSVRNALGTLPSDAIVSRLNRYFET